MIWNACAYFLMSERRNYTAATVKTHVIPVILYAILIFSGMRGHFIFWNNYYEAFRPFRPSYDSHIFLILRCLPVVIYSGRSIAVFLFFSNHIGHYFPCVVGLSTLAVHICLCHCSGSIALHKFHWSLCELHFEFLTYWQSTLFIPLLSRRCSFMIRESLIRCSWNTCILIIWCLVIGVEDIKHNIGVICSHLSVCFLLVSSNSSIRCVFSFPNINLHHFLWFKALSILFLSGAFAFVTGSGYCIDLFSFSCLSDSWFLIRLSFLSHTGLIRRIRDILYSSKHIQLHSHQDCLYIIEIDQPSIEIVAVSIYTTYIWEAWAVNVVPSLFRNT